MIKHYRLAAAPATADGGQVWDSFLRDLGDASAMAGVLIAVLYAWGGYERVRRIFTGTGSG